MGRCPADIETTRSPSGGHGRGAVPHHIQKPLFQVDERIVGVRGKAVVRHVLGFEVMVDTRHPRFLAAAQNQAYALMKGIFLGKQGAHSIQRRDDAAFVVLAAPAVDPSILHRALKRRQGPPVAGGTTSRCTRMPISSSPWPISI